MQIKYFRNERLEDLQTKICLNKNETNILIWLQEKSHSLQKVGDLFCHVNKMNVNEYTTVYSRIKYLHLGQCQITILQLRTNFFERIYFTGYEGCILNEKL